MRDAFIEVLYDLWDFIVQALNRLFRNQYRGKKMTGLVAPGVVTDFDYGQVAYVRHERIRCYSDNDRSTRVKLATYFYGEAVKVLRVENEGAEISKGLVHGWVDSDGLTTDPNEVFPKFELFGIYSENNVTTVRVRRCLKHRFEHTGNAYLTPEEYVLYRLLRDRVAIAWDDINSLPSKSWYQRLLGTNTVKIGDEPRTNSVLEYADSNGLIKQGYVTAVYPDHTIMVESVGREAVGEYRLEELSRVEWLTWRPVFITFM